jgi:hypothetical protein
MLERRKAHRPRTYIQGQIVFDGRNSTIDCLVRNLSDAGAKLTFADLVNLPEVFDFALVHKGAHFRARTKWRTRDELGIAFLNWGSDGIPVPLELARRIKTCEAERESLRQRVAELASPF